MQEEFAIGLGEVARARAAEKVRGSRRDGRGALGQPDAGWSSGTRVGSMAAAADMTCCCRCCRLLAMTACDRSLHAILTVNRWWWAPSTWQRRRWARWARRPPPWATRSTSWTTSCASGVLPGGRGIRREVQCCLEAPRPGSRLLPALACARGCPCPPPPTPRPACPHPAALPLSERASAAGTAIKESAVGRTAGAAFSKIGTASKKVLDSDKVRAGEGRAGEAASAGLKQPPSAHRPAPWRPPGQRHARARPSSKRWPPALRPPSTAAAAAAAALAIALAAAAHPPQPMAHPPAHFRRGPVALALSSHVGSLALCSGTSTCAPFNQCRLQVATATGAVGTSFKKLGASLSSLTGRKKEAAGGEVVPQVRWPGTAAAARMRLPCTPPSLPSHPC